MKEVEDERLKLLVDEHIAAYGRTACRCAFMASKDFSFRWSFKDRELDLKVSDYVRDAPDEALEDLVKGMLGYVFTKKPLSVEIFAEYVRSDEFILAHRPIFMKRAKNYAENGIGNVRSLYDSVQRLMDAGLITESDIDNSVFVWSRKTTFTRLGTCSTMMRVAAVSNIFDSPQYSEHALDYVVYHEIVHLRMGYRPFDRNPHDREFQRNIRLFPGRKEAEQEISTIPGARKKACGSCY